MLYFVAGAFETVSLLNSRTNENEPSDSLINQSMAAYGLPFLKHINYVD
jgi:hypothetical protein